MSAERQLVSSADAAEKPGHQRDHRRGPRWEPLKPQIVPGIFGASILTHLFGGSNIHLFALVCVVCFVLSGHSRLYTSQIIRFHKASTFQSARES